MKVKKNINNSNLFGPDEVLGLMHKTTKFSFFQHIAGKQEMHVQFTSNF